MRNSRASLFLMELMISILFFSLSSAVCIQLFVKAHTINGTTEDKSNATLIAQDISEYFHHANGDKKNTLSHFTEYEDTEEGVLLYFTQNNNCCSSAGAYYTVTLDFRQENACSLMTFTITRTGSSDTLYYGELKKHIPNVL